MENNINNINNEDTNENIQQPAADAAANTDERAFALNIDIGKLTENVKTVTAEVVAAVTEQVTSENARRVVDGARKFAANAAEHAAVIARRAQEYWRSGDADDYDEALEALDDEISALDDEISALDDEISALDDENRSELETDRRELEANRRELEANRRELRADRAAMLNARKARGEAQGAIADELRAEIAQAAAIDDEMLRKAVKILADFGKLSAGLITSTLQVGLMKSRRIIETLSRMRLIVRDPLEPEEFIAAPLHPAQPEQTLQPPQPAQPLQPLQPPQKDPVLALADLVNGYYKVFGMLQIPDPYKEAGRLIISAKNEDELNKLREMLNAEPNDLARFAMDYYDAARRGAASASGNPAAQLAGEVTQFYQEIYMATGMTQQYAATVTRAFLSIVGLQSALKYKDAGAQDAVAFALSKLTLAANAANPSNAGRADDVEADDVETDDEED